MVPSHQQQFHTTSREVEGTGPCETQQPAKHGANSPGIALAVPEDVTFAKALLGLILFARKLHSQFPSLNGALPLSHSASLRVRTKPRRSAGNEFLLRFLREAPEPLLQDEGGNYAFIHIRISNRRASG